MSRFGLRGSVKVCETHRTWYSSGCGPDKCEREERNDITIVEFRPDGSLQRQWGKNPAPNSSEWTNCFEYGNDDQLLTVRFEQGGSAGTVKSYEYDSAARISRVIMFDKEGNERIAETYSYEADGTKKKIVHIDPKLPYFTMFGVDGTDGAYSAPGATTITSIYDKRGRAIEHLFHKNSGDLVTRVDLRYDERGNLVEEVCTQQVPGEMAAQASPQQLETLQRMFTFGRRHRYDEQDRRIETSSNMAPNDFERETFAYNDHGDAIRTVSESSHAEYDFGEEGELTPKPDSIRSNRSETQFRYQYDPHGNWVEKIVEAGGGPIWSVERRTIRYFPPDANEG
jgi:hypothetical protein